MGGNVVSNRRLPEAGDLKRRPRRESRHIILVLYRRKIGSLSDTHVYNVLSRVGV
jgi:hypothetical protein